jgi:hypothetical protein
MQLRVIRLLTAVDKRVSKLAFETLNTKSF